MVLKILSTWPLTCQVCLVGQRRTYPPCEEAAVDLLRQQFLDERCGQAQERGRGGQGEGSGGGWVRGFAPRESHEPVKNCSQVDRGVSQFIADTIASELLQTQCLVDIDSAGVCGSPLEGRGSAESAGGVGSRKWNVGGEGCM